MRVELRFEGALLSVACALSVLGAALYAVRATGETRTAVVFEPLASSYGTFVEVKPVLVNTGLCSVYLPRYHPMAAAYPERRNERTGVWEKGKRPVRCGTGLLEQLPMELPPRARLKTYVSWESSVDERPEGAVFLLDASESRDLSATYRLVFEYALEPEGAEAGPSNWLLAVSPEFSISPNGRTERRP